MASEWEQVIPSRSQYDKHGLRQRRLSNDFLHLRAGFSADPLKDDDWARRHALRYGGFDNSKWLREQGIDYTAFGGQRIWPMLSATMHHAIVDISECTLYRIIDHGIRHPTVCLWVALNANKDRHIYREYYATDRSIAMNCRRILAQTPTNESIKATFIDPSVKKRTGESIRTLLGVYAQNDISCSLADNTFAGYDLVMTALMATLARKAIAMGIMPEYLRPMNPSQDEILKLAEKSALTFDMRFTERCFTETRNLRWKQLKGDETQVAPREQPVDKDDDGPDCVRYAIASGLIYVKPPSSTVTVRDLRVAQKMKQDQRTNEESLKRWERRGAYA